MSFRTRYIILNLISKWGKEQCLPNDRISLPRWRGTKYFSYNFYTCTNPFIHLLGSSLIQWIIVRLNGREELKQSVQVRLGESSLCLGGPESSENLTSGSPRRRCLRLGVDSYA